MTRIFITSLLALCCLTQARGQADAGTFSLLPRVGVSIANMSGNSLTISGGDTDLTLSSRSKAGFVAGAEGRYQATSQVAVSLGAYYASLGNKYKDCDICDARTATTADYTSYTGMSNTLDYVLLPVMAHVFVARGLALEAGVQLGLLTHAVSRTETASYQIDTESGQRTELSAPHTIEQKGTDTYRKCDVAIPLGVSYEYTRVVLSARYHLGLGKVTKFADSKNRYFTFSVGYRL